MNGVTPRLSGMLGRYFFTHPVICLIVMRGRPELRRLALALLLSLLLHAALVLRWPVASGPPATGAHDLAKPAMAIGIMPPQSTSTPSSPGSRHQPESGTAGDPAPRTPPPSPDARGHYPAESLTRPPRPLQDIELSLPEAALLTTPGRMRLTLWIDTDGHVVAYHIDAPDLPEEYTTAVAEVFARTRYTPGEYRGRKVGSILKMEIEHQPPGPSGR